MEWERQVANDEQKRGDPWYGAENDEAESDGWSSDNPFAAGLPPADTIRKAYTQKGYGTLETQAPRRKRRSACLSPPFPLLCVLLVSCVILTGKNAFAPPTLGVATSVGLRETKKPTPRPTPMPSTLTPTISKAPTAGTYEPSNVPTRGPTLAPTPRPTTYAPTPQPTRSPTPEPTPRPTESPTPQPSPSPTAKPTAEPTAEPTAQPTARPSPAPSAKPTAEPTAKPTAEPSARPTLEPTARPSPLPSERPTREPTFPPTHRPTRPPRTDKPTRPPRPPRRLANDVIAPARFRARGGADDVEAAGEYDEFEPDYTPWPSQKPVPQPILYYDDEGEYVYDEKKSTYKRSKSQTIAVYVMIFLIVAGAVGLALRIACTRSPRWSKAPPVEASPLIGREYEANECAPAVPIGEDEVPLHYEAFGEHGGTMII